MRKDGSFQKKDETKTHFYLEFGVKVAVEIYLSKTCGKSSPRRLIIY